MTNRHIHLPYLLIIAVLILVAATVSKRTLMEEDLGVRTALRYGASLDHVTLQAAITALGSDQVTLLITPGTWTLGSNLTFPSTMRVWFAAGAVFSHGVNTLTFNGGFAQAGADPTLRQLFIGSGLVSVSGHVETIYPQWFGAIVNDGLEDSTAINQAIVTSQAWGTAAPTNSLFRRRVVAITAGDWHLSDSLNVYGLTRLLGEGQWVSQLKTLAGFTGTEALSLMDTLTAANHSNSELGYLNVDVSATPSVAVLRCQATQYCGRSWVHHLVYTGAYGLMFGGDISGGHATKYNQSHVIEHIVSHGAEERILFLSGNEHMVRNIEKAGETAGTTDEPYIHVLAWDNPAFSANSGPSQNNTLTDILIQQATGALKAAITLEGAPDTTLADLWIEPTNTPDYMIRILPVSAGSPIWTSVNSSIKGALRCTITGSLPCGIEIQNSLNISIEQWDLDIGSSRGLVQSLSIDEDSTLVIHRLYTRVAQDILSETLSKNVRVKSIINRSSGSVAGQLPLKQYIDGGSDNLFVNGSLEGGRRSWTFAGTLGVPDSLEEYIASAFSPGLMGHFGWTSAGSGRIVQGVFFPTGTAGLVLTISAKAQVHAGTGAIIAPYNNGCGTVDNVSYDQITEAAEKATVTRTITLVSDNCTLTAGVAWNNLSELWVDDIKLSVGAVSTPYGNRFGSIDLGGRVLGFCSAAPTTGTCQQGDFCFNIAPTAGGTFGWSCTTGGSYGTWTALTLN